MTVAGRIQLAYEALKHISITTEVLPIIDQVVIKATITTNKGTFTGISAANPNKIIEKYSPYEVAETSAIGRALGFAGFGSMDGITTADEIVKADQESNDTPECTCDTTGRYHAVDCPARDKNQKMTH